MGKETGKLFKIEIGDPYADGHGLYETVMVSVKNTDCLETDYKNGVTKTGLDITNYCNDYEDSRLPKTFIEKLEKLGFDVMDIDNVYYLRNNPDQDIDDYCHIYYYEYLDIWMFIAKQGNEKLEWEEITGEGTIQPGGYGLFCL